MRVVNHRPAARGVSQLMYVGDDHAVESAVSVSTPVKIAVVIVIAWLVLGRR
jgi:hypothetical protein